MLQRSSENQNPFELLSSSVVHAVTGEELDATKVFRGQRRLETLTFKVGTRLVGLRQQIVTAKNFGLGFVNVGLETIQLGTFKAQSEAYTYELPERVIPDTPLAKGRYKIKISFAAYNMEQVLHTEQTKEITIT